MNKRKQHYIVTGGAGFIGSNIALRLLSQGHEVTVLDDLSTGKRENVPAQAAFIAMDLGTANIAKELGDLTCDAVFHLAGQSSGPASFNDPGKDFRSHVVATFNLLEWCKQKGVSRFLYASSMGVYGDPVSLPVDEQQPLNPKSYYGAGKACAEAYIRLYQLLGINTTIFRLFSVYGAGQNLDNRLQGIVSIFLSYMLKGEKVPVRGSKDRFRDFVYIDDVVDVWLRALNNPISFGKIYNIAACRKTTVEELIALLKERIGDPRYPVEYKGETPGDQFGVFASFELVQKELGWQPTVDLETGLSIMVEKEREKIHAC